MGTEGKPVNQFGIRAKIFREMDCDISVIMAAYNAEDTIQQALSSVLHQTFEDFELIVVDDASTDNTVEVAQRMADKRTRIVRHQTNQGAAAARNTALDLACGTWATVLDADDAWHPERLEVLTQAANNHPEAFFGDKVMLSYPDATGTLIPWRSQTSLHGLKLSGDLTKCDLTTLIEHRIDIKPFFPLKAIQKFGIRQCEEAFPGEWLPFIVELFKAGLNLFLIDSGLYYYRATGSHSTSSYHSVKQQVMVVDAILQDSWINERVRTALLKRRTFLEQRRPWVALRQGLYRQAAKDLWHAPNSVLFLLRKVPYLVSKFITNRIIARQRREEL